MIPQSSMSRRVTKTQPGSLTDLAVQTWSVSFCCDDNSKEEYCAPDCASAKIFREAILRARMLGP